MERWYVVQTKPSQEKLAVVNLERLGFEVFFPQYMEQKRKRGKIVPTLASLFPSYLFVCFDIDVKRWKVINSTRGVYQLVTATEERASPLPRGFVEDLIGQQYGVGYISPAGLAKTLTTYSVGEPLKVVDGLFSGMSGTCDTVRKDTIVVLLSLLSGEMKVELPLNMVKSGQN